MKKFNMRNSRFYNVNRYENDNGRIINNGCNVNIECVKAGKHLDCGGYLTVEATLVVSEVLFVLSVMIIFIFIIYQNVLLTKAASAAAQQGAEIWVDSRKAIENGEWDDNEKADSVYNHLTSDLFSGGFKYKEIINITHNPEDEYEKACITNGIDGLQSKKVVKIRQTIYSNLSRGILKPVSTELDIEYKNTLIQRVIKITITQQIRIPFGQIKALFDGRDTIIIKGSGTAVIAEPAEYLRNVDFALECANRLGAALDTKSIINGIKSGINNNRADEK